MSGQTTCTASPFGMHDYSAPPHATPDEPRPAGYHGGDGIGGECHAQSAQEPFGICEHRQVYELVMFQIATHEWITLRACGPCTAALRHRHRPEHIHRVRSSDPRISARWSES